MDQYIVLRSVKKMRGLEDAALIFGIITSIILLALIITRGGKDE